MRIPKTFTDEERDEAKLKKVLDELKDDNIKKLPVEEDIKMDWWDKFVGGIKEGRITIWFWIIILIAMIFAFSVSTVKIDFNIEGDINYKHPEIFQLKGDLND